MCELITGSSICFHCRPVCFLCQYQTVFIIVSVIELDVVMVMFLEVPLLYRIVLAILGFLFLHKKLSIVLLRSVRNVLGF